MTLSLLTRNNAKTLIPLSDRKVLKRQLTRAIRASGLLNAQICLSLSDDNELSQLNQTYANEEHPTDVLSFAQPFPQPLRKETALWGDIIISVETAKRQAEAAGHSLLQELLHLAIHGFCHLMGYDHATKQEEQVMFGYTKELQTQALGRGKIRLVAPSVLQR